MSAHEDGIESYYGNVASSRRRWLPRRPMNVVDQEIARNYENRRFFGGLDRRLYGVRTGGYQSESRDPHREMPRGPDGFHDRGGPPLAFDRFRSRGF